MRRRSKAKTGVFLSTGFTLVELMLVASMLSVIALAIFATFSNGLDIWERLNRDVMRLNFKGDRRKLMTAKSIYERLQTEFADEATIACSVKSALETVQKENDSPGILTARPPVKVKGSIKPRDWGMEK